MICAEAEDQLPGDPCYGDVGNPLVVDGTLIGITMWSFDCGTPFSPWIFTNVAYYEDWLNPPTTTTEEMPTTSAPWTDTPTTGTNY